MSLFPKITFRVKIYELNEVLASTPDQDLEQRLAQLNSVTIAAPGVARPMKHGETFSLRGQQALYLKNNIQQYFEVINIDDEAAGVPRASFDSSSTDLPLPVTVTFTDTSTFTPLEWIWDFGDGTTSTEQNPVHIYEDIGLFTVSLTVSNDEGSNTLIVPDYIDTTGEARAPSVPLNLSIVPIVTHDTVPLSWDAPADPGSAPIDEYLVQIKDDGLAPLSGDGFVDYGTTADTHLDVTGLNSLKTYEFRVAASNAVGASPYTDPVVQDTPFFPFPETNLNIQLTVNGDANTVFSNDPGDPDVEALDGDPIGLWGYNGGAVEAGNVGRKPTYRKDLVNGDRVFNAVEFQGGTRLRFIDDATFNNGLGFGAGDRGIECSFVMRRFAPQPPTDRQTTGLWWMTSEASPPTTNATDTHYPEDNAVIYERFGSGSDTRRSVFPVPIDVTQWHIYQVRGREGEYKIWINGQLVLNSSDNTIIDAITSARPTIGVSYFEPPVDDNDESAMWGGYFQTPEIVWFCPVEAALESITEEEAIAARDLATAQMLAYHADKYGIVI